MTTAVQPPTAQLVDEAIKKFDEENAVVEDALKKLFTQYPANTNLSHVLLKVVALNRLYSTQIFAVVDVAQHIHRNGTEIDSSLAIGSPEVVDKIAKVTISKSGKERNNFSFATKYCSWHNPESYPIFDTQVDRKRVVLAVVMGGCQSYVSTQRYVDTLLRSGSRCVGSERFHGSRSWIFVMGWSAIWVRTRWR